MGIQQAMQLADLVSLQCAGLVREHDRVKCRLDPQREDESSI